MRHSVFLSVIVFIFLSYGSVWAASTKSKSAAQSTKIGFVQQNYAGTLNQSFSDGSPGYGIEISVDRGNTFLRYFLKGRVMHSEGTQNFLAGSTPFKSFYKYTAFAPELGISLYPVTRRDKGLNLYVWAVGTISYNFLELDPVPTGSNIRTRDQAAGYGYGGGLGFEFMLGGARSQSRSMIYGEVAFRDERAQLLQTNSFEVAGITFSLGFGF
ncbi:MAG: hypothetical protein H7256_05945 [Bdellovibrio sp.]|nr:hypothetical protein [Bdellovibrio sp.]